MPEYQPVWRTNPGKPQRQLIYRSKTLEDAIVRAERAWLDNNPPLHPLVGAVLRARFRADPFTAIHWESPNGSWEFWIEPADLEVE